MQINRPLADPSSSGDICHRGFIVAVMNEQLGGHAQDGSLTFRDGRGRHIYLDFDSLTRFVILVNNISLIILRVKDDVHEANLI